MSLQTAVQDKSKSVLLVGSLVLLFVSLLGLLHFSGKLSLLNYAFPAGALMLGAWLYVALPTYYIGYTLWIWFLTPFARRVIDYQLGHHTPQSPVILTPMLVTGLCVVTLFRSGGVLTKRRYAPFLLTILGVLYGFLVGLVKVGPLSATYALLQWMLPLLFGFHLLRSWRKYPSYRRILKSTFTWGVLIVGTYALFQYLAAPPWDMQWLVGSGMTSSMGQPEPREFRVFSTMNATGPFAKMVMVAVLVLFAESGLVSRLATVPGYGSLLLSLVRSAWGGWLVGLTYLVIRIRGAMRARLVGILVVSILMCIPLLMFTPNVARVENRAESLTNLEHDVSYQGRIGLYRTAGPKVLTNPIGNGIGYYGTAAKLSRGTTVSFDAGLVEVPLALGWPGVLLYVGGLVWMMVEAVRIKISDTDEFAVVAVGIVVAILSLLIFSNQFKGLGALFMWSFLGIALAAKTYYAENATTRAPHATLR